VLLDRGVQAVVDGTRDLECDGVGKFLPARCSMRKHLDVDTGLVHFLDTKLTEVVEALFQFRRADHVAALELLDQFRVPKVFFDRNHLRPGLLRHDVSSSAFVEAFRQFLIAERPTLS
jgi:hypothetical protein